MRRLERAIAEALAAVPVEALPTPADTGSAAGPADGAAGPGTVPADAGAPVALTPRERQVAALLAAGCRSDRQLAERLAIAPGTAGVHVQRVLEKLGLHSRWQVAAGTSEPDPRAAPAP